MKLPPISSAPLIGAFLLLLVLRTLLGSTYRAAVAPGGMSGVDFGVIVEAASRLDRGDPLYLSEHEAKKKGVLLCQFTCSPLVPVLTRAISHLPKDTAYKVWVAAALASLLAGCLLTAWGMRVRFLQEAGLLALILISGFRFWPVVLELTIGNTHLFLFMLVGGMVASCRHKQWILFAALVAVAALIKTWMLGALFFLMVVRQWRAVLAGIFGFLGGLAILFSIVGWHELTGFVNVTHEYARETFLVSNSVAGIARMLFTQTEFMTPWLDNRAVFALALVVGYGGLVAGLLLLYIKGSRHSAEEYPLLLALTISAMVIGVPMSHVLYFVLVLPLFWTVILHGRNGEGRDVGSVVAAIGAYLILSMPLPCLTPIPAEYQFGVKSIMVCMTLLPVYVLWCVGARSILRKRFVLSEALDYTRTPNAAFSVARVP